MKKQSKDSLKSENEKLKKSVKKINASLKTMKDDLKIEASLERVRSQAMSLRKQEETSGICEVLFSELRKFGFKDLRNTQIFINNDDNESFLNYDYSDFSGATIINVYFNSNARTRDFLEKIGKEEDAFIESVISGDELEEWKKWRTEMGDYEDPRIENINSLYYYSYSIGTGAVGISTFKPISKKELVILKRFRNVFALAYRRYMDVRQAEAQKREAQIELALERVRARTMAMQKSEELPATAYILFQQFRQLGENPIQIGIGIMDEIERVVEFNVTDWRGGGEALNRVFKGSFDEPTVIKKVFTAWKANKKSVVIDLTGKDLEGWVGYRNLISRTEIGLADHGGRRVITVAFFSKGFISNSTPQPIAKETVQLLERFAAVFNITYTRFNDLKLAEYQAEQAHLDLIKLQSEKKRAEDALSDLRITQKQLIQSEKMASLGELTAGIAHEIQNPLNFVNNFSEVSNELVDEMNIEIEKGDLDEAKLIAFNIKGNLEKIAHHGKRADAIVKSMLQHSGRGSGKKESADINALTDEYLRLTYHGLRAKEMSFNATMTTDYDSTIGKIDIISQDIGRVLLNLINNAFYAVNEKKKSGVESYEPTVTVSTRKSGTWVEIRIADNGNGIPPNVMDKIFQPFFTTKPTGEGTGLGLSLSYDIIKAHGGELKVVSGEGSGAEFSVLLPST